MKWVAGGGKRCEGAGWRTYERCYGLCGSFSYIRLRDVDVGVYAGN